jgi:hypothetical protein
MTEILNTQYSYTKDLFSKFRTLEFGLLEFICVL